MKAQRGAENGETRLNMCCLYKSVNEGLQRCRKKKDMMIQMLSIYKSVDEGLQGCRKKTENQDAYVNSRSQRTGKQEKTRDNA